MWDSGLARNQPVNHLSSIELVVQAGGLGAGVIWISYRGRGLRSTATESRQGKDEICWTKRRLAGKVWGNEKLLEIHFSMHCQLFPFFTWRIASPVQANACLAGFLSVLPEPLWIGRSFDCSLQFWFLAFNSDYYLSQIMPWYTAYWW